jgi:hypothetical protein
MLFATHQRDRRGRCLRGQGAGDLLLTEPADSPNQDADHGGLPLIVQHHHVGQARAFPTPRHGPSRS